MEYVPQVSMQSKDWMMRARARCRQVLSGAGQRKKPQASSNDAVTLRAQKALQQVATLVMWLRRVLPCVEHTGKGGRDIVLRKP